MTRAILISLSLAIALATGADAGARERKPARVVAVSSGWIWLASDAPIAVGDAFELRSPRWIRYPLEGRWRVKRTLERRGGVQIEVIDGALAGGRAPRGTLAAVGDVALPLAAPLAETRYTPRLWREMTRVQGSLRPFLSLLSLGFGVLSELSIDHYFKEPIKVGVELSPVGFLGERDGTGAIANARVRVAWAGDWLELGLAVGGRFQAHRRNSPSFAASLRIGSLDGLHLEIENGYELLNNYFTGQTEFVLSDINGELAIPLSRRLTLALAGGYGRDFWAYGILGLRHYVKGGGGPGTVILGGGAGFAGLIDHCRRTDPGPCLDAAWGYGPTISFSTDVRF